MNQITGPNPIRIDFMDAGKYNGLGYDAKHVSAVLQFTREHLADGEHGTVPADAVQDVVEYEFSHSVRLAAKYRGAVDRFNAKVLAKVAKAEAKKSAKGEEAGGSAEFVQAKGKFGIDASKGATEVVGYKESEVKVGRWTYPARIFTDGSVERNTKRDGSGEWVAA